MSARAHQAAILTFSHVTIRFAIYHFLLVVRGTEPPTNKRTNTNKHDGSQYLLADDKLVL